MDSSIKPSNESEQIDISSSFRERYVHQEPNAVSLTHSSQEKQPYINIQTSPGNSNNSGNQSQDPRSVTTITSFPPTSNQLSVISGSTKSGNSSGAGTTVSAARKPRRPPPSRPIKPPPSPGPHDLPRPVDRMSIVSESDSATQRQSLPANTAATPPPITYYSPRRRQAPLKQKGPSSSPLDSLASTVGNQTPVNHANVRSTPARSTRGSSVDVDCCSNTTSGAAVMSSSGTSCQRDRPLTFEPILMSTRPRGGTPKKNRRSSSAPRGRGGAQRRITSDDADELFVENSYNTRSFHDSSNI